MRKLRYILAILLVIIILPANGKEKLPNKTTVTNVEGVIIGDSIKLRMIINIPRERVDICTSIVLTPIISYQNIRQVLPEIVLAGRNNYALIKRDPVFNTYKMREEKLLLNYKYSQYKTYKGVKSKTGFQIIYQETIKYADWIKNAKIEIYQSIMRCNNEKVTEQIYDSSKIKITQ